MENATDAVMAGHTPPGRSWGLYGTLTQEPSDATLGTVPASSRNVFPPGANMAGSDLEESNRVMEQHFDFESAANSPGAIHRPSPLMTSPVDTTLAPSPETTSHHSRPVSAGIGPVETPRMHHRLSQWPAEGARAGFGDMGSMSAHRAVAGNMRIQTDGAYSVDDRSLPNSMQVSPLATTTMMTRQSSSPTAYFSANPPTPIPGMTLWDDPELGGSPADSQRWYNELNPPDPSMMSITSPSGGSSGPQRPDAIPSPDARLTTMAPSSAMPTLTIHPTHFKSRVETQVPIRLYLHPMPPGITKLHLPPFSISKPKLMASPPPVPSPDTLELVATLVCASAMTREHRLQRAFARAAGVPEPAAETNTSSSSEGSPAEGGEEDKSSSPHGEEVKICARCIDRERKRAARKKNWSVEEQEIFSRDEHLRVIVFNTHEIKEWQPPSPVNSRDVQRTGPLPQMPEGAMQVHLPMRIACYCRHHNEKLGFRVIFTLKDYRGAVVAQAITTSIMITDDHKTHPIPPSPTMPSSSTNTLTAGSNNVGVLSTPSNQSQGRTTLATGGGSAPRPAMRSSTFDSGMAVDAALGPPRQGPAIPSTATGVSPFRLSHSSSDLPSLRSADVAPLTPATHRPNRHSMHSRRGSFSSRSTSRQASPSAPTGPASKRRKPSREARLPSGLVMTRLDDPAAQQQQQPPPQQQQQFPTATAGPHPELAIDTTSTVPSPYGPPEGMHMMSPEFFPTASGGMPRGSHYHTGPPTPNRSYFSPDQAIGYPGVAPIPPQAFSAPTSAHHSRAPSPSTGFRPTALTLQQAQIAQAISNGLAQNGVTSNGHYHHHPHHPHHSHRTNGPVSIPLPMDPNRPPRIHRLIADEGPKSGGIEVACVGEGFYQGLEVIFGNIPATTTTFWNEQLLVLLLPPSPQAGVVTVRFRHELVANGSANGSPPPISGGPGHPVVFRYLDMDELQLLRTALTIIGVKMMGRYEDSGNVARRILRDRPGDWGGGPYHYQQQMRPMTTTGSMTTRPVATASTATAVGHATAATTAAGVPLPVPLPPTERHIQRLPHRHRHNQSVSRPESDLQSVDTLEV
ncbi:MAG: hypothetical protein M1823_003749 [Watsoniomyces obsoletus]|nr:MAG: hypothetical protein M1823_003749 [Watsoniomyces obsoletus]